MSNITNPEDLKLPAASVATGLKQVADEKTTFNSEFEAAVAQVSTVLLNSNYSLFDYVNEEGRFIIKAEDIMSDFNTFDISQLQNKVMKRPARNGQTANGDVVEEAYRQLNKDLMIGAFLMTKRRCRRLNKFTFTRSDIIDAMGMITYPQLRKLFDEALKDHRDLVSVANKKVKK